jgi:hypothetical protein
MTYAVEIVGVLVVLLFCGPHLRRPDTFWYVQRTGKRAIGRLGRCAEGRRVVRPPADSEGLLFVLVALLPGVPLAPPRPASSSLDRVQGAGDRRASAPEGGTSPAERSSAAHEDCSCLPGCGEPATTAPRAGQFNEARSPGKRIFEARHGAALNEPRPLRKVGYPLDAPLC